MSQDEAPLLSDLAEAPAGGCAVWLDAVGARLRAATWHAEPGRAPRGTALIFTGRAEYIEKYGRVAGELTGRGFAVATLDWRGQGLSDRPLEDRLKGHVGDFAEYQEDVKAFLAAPEVAALPGPQVLICHSMGGCIGMRALIEGRVAPAATIMSAPMLGVRLNAAMRFGARAMIRVARRFGFETSFAPAPNADQPYVLHQPFEGNLLTNDPEHFAWMVGHLKTEPALGLGAPTLGWMARAFTETDALIGEAPPSGPMLMMLGEEEAIVEPAAIRVFSGRVDGCRLLEIEGAQHEIFFERAPARETAWAEIDSFLAAAGV